MEKKGRYTRKGIRWLGSLLAACLWLWLPARATVLAPDSDRQTYVSAHNSPTGSDNTDLGSVVHNRDSAAFIGVRTGPTFPPSCDWLPGHSAPMFCQSTVRQSEHRGRTGASPICLRSIFEHQITINAP